MGVSETAGISLPGQYDDVFGISSAGIFFHRLFFPFSLVFSLSYRLFFIWSFGGRNEKREGKSDFDKGMGASFLFRKTLPDPVHASPAFDIWNIAVDILVGVNPFL